MQDTGSLGLMHWDDPEGWDGKGGGKGVQDGVFNDHENNLELYLKYGN